MIEQPKQHGKIVVALMLLTCFFVSCATGVSCASSQRVVKAEGLPMVGSMDELYRLLGQAFQSSQRMGPTLYYDAGMKEMKADAAPAGVEENTAYSGTNVQVEGVDEADLVKTDGKYIYRVDGRDLLIIQAVPAAQMKLVARISLKDSLEAREIYLHGDKLVLLGMEQNFGPIVIQEKRMIYPPIRTQAVTAMIIYDIKDRSHPQELRRIDLQGDYLSSRKIGSQLYLVSNRYVDYICYEKKTDLLPSYRDSLQGSDFKEIPVNSIHYFPDCISPNYLLVAGLDLDGRKSLKLESYLGGAEAIYASANALYVAASTFKPVPVLRDTAQAPVRAAYGPETSVFKFSLQGGTPIYAGRAEVPGRILNQFSMDEHKGLFRIATTSTKVNKNESYSSNNLYILDSGLNKVGQIEDIAPGEQIYSTRFMGDRVYMVTFKNVDPFFVIDAKNPSKPVVLGQLKIPGYSDYLHPYDENHVIGFGKDTVEAKGWGDQPQAFYQGMKVAVFDVSNVRQPQEKCREIIGVRGTDSELLRDHKALLFSREKSLLAFPVIVFEREKGQSAGKANYPNTAMEYGQFSFQGAYIYSISPGAVLSFKGRISHMSAEDYLKSGHYAPPGKSIDRLLYIGNTLYTLSPHMVQAHDLKSLKLTGTLSLQE